MIVSGLIMHYESMGDDLFSNYIRIVGGSVINSDSTISDFAEYLDTTIWSKECMSLKTDWQWLWLQTDSSVDFMEWKDGKGKVIT